MISAHTAIYVDNVWMHHHRLLRTRDVADLLNISVSYLRKLIKRGMVPPPDFSDGRIYRWQRSTIVNLLGTTYPPHQP